MQSRPRWTRFRVAIELEEFTYVLEAFLGENSFRFQMASKRPQTNQTNNCRKLYRISQITFEQSGYQ